MAAVILNISLSVCFFFHKEKALECRKNLSRIIKKEKDYYRYSAIYLIDSLNYCCCPLIDYGSLQSNPNLRIIFMFKPDYTDSAIQNFIRVFNIDNIERPVDIRRMDDEWLYAYLRCNKNKRINLNFLINVVDGNIVGIKGF
ncbi:MAG: hypothetical protein ACUVRL_01830 [Candidatus Saccharicenans sp.]|uniref:hypothetical protein n=1 Tax=Candidatus Saccharicenans sp. TaxID=2819258 RepID=UPI00404B1153